MAQVRASLDAIMPRLYSELKRQAENYLRHERPDHTLQPTALVHEAYLRLAKQAHVDWQSRSQVLGLAAQMMRRVLRDYAAARNAAKRQGQFLRLSLTDAVGSSPPMEAGFIDLDRALAKLAAIDSQAAAIVELRFFGGLTVEEAAEALQISPASVDRDWAAARLWLLRHLSQDAAE